MNERQRNFLVTEIRTLLVKKIQNPDELAWHELAEEILKDVLESVTMRLDELRLEGELE